MPFTTELAQLIRQCLVLYAQPVVDLRTDEVLYFEILCRFRCGDGQIDEAPAQWIAELERFELIHLLDRQVFSMLLEHLSRTGDRQTYAINLSGQTINHSGLFTRIIPQEIAAAGVDPKQIFFELTETILLEDTEIVRATVHLLVHEYTLALDDFGSGVFTIESLERLRPSIVKIDGSFARKLPHSFRQDYIDIVCSCMQCSLRQTPDLPKELMGCFFVSAIAQMAHAVGSYVVLEHIESETQKQWATLLGVDYIQGYLSGPPKRLI